MFIVTIYRVPFDFEERTISESSLAALGRLPLGQEWVWKHWPTEGHPPNVKIHESGRNTLYCKIGSALETRGHMFGGQNQLFSHVLICNSVTSLYKNIIWQDSRNTLVKTEELASVQLVPLKVHEETPNRKTKKTCESVHLGERRKKNYIPSSFHQPLKFKLTSPRIASVLYA